MFEIRTFGSVHDIMGTYQIKYLTGTDSYGECSKISNTSLSVFKGRVCWRLEFTKHLSE